MTQARQRSVFGRRSEPHTVIIARGDRISHFTVRPWVAMVLGSVLAAMAVGYLMATTYLVLRDDLIGASVARQARMQQSYEDRISMLRAQLDRVTSRQLLDQQVMESKVSELLERQTVLTQRHGRIGPLLDRLREDGVQIPDEMPVPQLKPEIRAGGGSLPVLRRPAGQIPDQAAAVDRSDRLFVEISRSLRDIETEQLAGIGMLAARAYETAGEIAAALESVGLRLDAPGDEATGGPYIPINGAGQFEDRVRELDEALDRLDQLRGTARRMPIFNPSPGHSISSNFGPRRDPLLRTPAFHSGIDFRAPPGAPIKSAGAGTVVTAGWNGGYGRMVEVDHGDGLTTRYAHMSRISVEVGEMVENGAVLGRVGSTGRSTGPHLHFEVRRNGDAVDPRPFLSAGRKVAELL